MVGNNASRLFCLFYTICAVVAFGRPGRHGPPDLRRRPPPWIHSGDGPPPWITEKEGDEAAPSPAANTEDEESPASEAEAEPEVQVAADPATAEPRQEDAVSSEAGSSTEGIAEGSEEGEEEGDTRPGRAAGWGRGGFGGGGAGDDGDGSDSDFGRAGGGGRGDGDAARGGAGGGGARGSALGFDRERATLIRKIHGIIAAIVFVIVFPFGAMLMRVVPGRFAIWIHAFVQVLGFAGYLAAAGLGIYLTQYVTIPVGNGSMLSEPSVNFHPIIGLVVLAALFLQPFFGVIHHIRFKKLKRRQIWSHIHLWIGRIFITLGIINGGLGLWIARESKSLTISYGVVAGVIWLLWMLVALVTELRRARASRKVRRKKRVVPGGSD